MDGAWTEVIGGDPVGPVGAPTSSWLAAHRYLLLAGAVVVLTALQTLTGQWSSDMWEHVAVVRELIAHPFDPQHPQLLADAPHPGFTPYAVVLGLIGNGLGVSAVTVLSWAAVVNVILLLLALRALVLRVTRNRRAPFWTLVSVLLLWGMQPYRYSGFFNLNSIGFVAPYPSTFATAVAFATLASALRFVRGGGRRWLAAIAGGAALVLVVHPLSAPWLGMALLVIGATHLQRPERLALYTASAVAAVLLAVAWPYFSMIDLVRDSGSLEGLNQSMYANVLSRVFPLLLGLIAVARRWRRDRRDVLSAWLAGGLVLYGAGAGLDNTSLGRSLAFIVVLLAMAVGDWVGRVEAAVRLRDSSRAVQLAAAGLTALLLLGLIATRGGLVRMVPEPLLPSSVRDSRELVRPDERYAFLRRHVGPNDVVLGSRKADNRVIPAIAGRSLVLATPRPFVDDLASRARAQRELLDPGTTPDRRAEISDEYDVRFVLLHVGDRRDQNLLDQLERAGASELERSSGLVLVEL